MKSAEERGPFGAWLVDQRKKLSERQGKPVRQQDLVAALSTFGYPIEESYYRALEGGSKLPGRELREHLARFFEASPPELRPKADQSEIVAAIREQTAAISGLVQTVQLLLAAQLGGDEEALRAEVARLVPGGVLAAGPPPPQPGTQP